MVPLRGPPLVASQLRVASFKCICAFMHLGVAYPPGMGRPQGPGGAGAALRGLLLAGRLLGHGILFELVVQLHIPPGYLAILGGRGQVARTWWGPCSAVGASALWQATWAWPTRRRAGGRRAPAARASTTAPSLGCDCTGSDGLWRGCDCGAVMRGQCAYPLKYRLFS